MTMHINPIITPSRRRRPAPIRLVHVAWAVIGLPLIGGLAYAFALTFFVS